VSTQQRYGGRIGVTDNPEERRYELWLGDRVAGHLTYRLRGGTRIALLHAEVDPASRGKGLGDELIESVLADVRARGLQVVPLCPFVKAYMTRHPETQDLVAPAPGTP
jgi:predicted GNAT family acetyltransferase